MDTNDFDVIVIGAGPAGETAAGRVADHGLSVAIVERELVGGECSYWGCIPSKTLIRPGDVVAAARRVPGAAQAVTGSIDATAALAQRDYMTSGWDDAGQLPWLEQKGITLLRGVARLDGERKVVVSTDAASRTLTASRAVVLATGTVPAVPPIPGLADIGAWSNRDATATKEVPARLLVLGGGAIGLELTQAFRRLGAAEVTVVEAAPRLLAREEPFAGDQVADALRSEGIRVETGIAVVSVRRDDSRGVAATLADGRELFADDILVAVGRRPNTSDLGLESIGIEAGGVADVDGPLPAPRAPRRRVLPGGGVHRP